jgi:hypothetical protein
VFTCAAALVAESEAQIRVAVRRVVTEVWFMRIEYWKSCGASEWNASTASTVRGFLSNIIKTCTV